MAGALLGPWTRGQVYMYYMQGHCRSLAGTLEQAGALQVGARACRRDAVVRRGHSLYSTYSNVVAWMELYTFTVLNWVQS